MKVVILAAGKGTRCLPLTEKTPKVLLQMNGDPFLSYLLHNLRKAGFSEYIIIVGHLKEKIADYVHKNDVNAVLIEQKEQLGTGHALMQVERLLAKESFLLVSGDNLYAYKDIREIAKATSTTVAGIPVRNPERYGVLLTENGRLKQILEKPKHPPSNLINTGLYKFTPEIFQALKQIKITPVGEYYLTDAINLLAAEGKVDVKQLKDYWLDLGRLEDIPSVESRLRKLF